MGPIAKVDPTGSQYGGCHATQATVLSCPFLSGSCLPRGKKSCGVRIGGCQANVKTDAPVGIRTQRGGHGVEKKPILVLPQVAELTDCPVPGHIHLHGRQTLVQELLVPGGDWHAGMLRAQAEGVAALVCAVRGVGPKYTTTGVCSDAPNRGCHYLSVSGYA